MLTISPALVSTPLLMASVWQYPPGIALFSSLLNIIKQVLLSRISVLRWGLAEGGGESSLAFFRGTRGRWRPMKG